MSAYLSVTEVRDLLGHEADGLSDEQLMEIRVETEELAQLLLEQFAGGARAPKNFVSTLDARTGRAVDASTASRGREGFLSSCQT